MPASELGLYEWDGRTIKAHRADVRKYFGFRKCFLADADRAADWLAVRVCDKERPVDRLREEMDAELSALNDALGGKGLAWLKIAERRNTGAIQLTPLDAAPNRGTCAG